MPLLDHFHPPLYPQHHWQSFHANWTTRLADAIQLQLPPEFQVEENSPGANLEIDVATYENEAISSAAARNGPATQLVSSWAPPAPSCTMPAVFPETFEVRVFSTTSGLTLVGAIEIVSPGNKDRPEERRVFAIKCANYLQQGVSLIIMDVVTNRRTNLHNETMRIMAADRPCEMADKDSLYAVAYRPLRRQDRAEIDMWKTTFSLGGTLPTLPLRLTGDLFVTVDFEATYQEACKHRRLA